MTVCVTDNVGVLQSSGDDRKATDQKMKVILILALMGIITSTQASCWTNIRADLKLSFLLALISLTVAISDGCSSICHPVS